MKKTKENEDFQLDKKRLGRIAKALSKGTKGEAAIEFMRFQESYGTLRKMLINDSARISKIVVEMGERWGSSVGCEELPCMEALRRLPDMMLSGLRTLRRELEYAYRAAANGGRDPDARKKKV